MSQFLGTHQNRLDAKGRTSVPAPFRNALRNGHEAGVAALILRPSHKHPCIEAWPKAAFLEATAGLSKLELFNDDADDLSVAFCAEAWPVEADKEGRIILPDTLVLHANLAESVVFMGLGRHFQIWEPSAAGRRTAEARENARVRRLTLPASGPQPGVAAAP